MKKFICLLFVLLLVPLVSFSADRDPVIGCYYLYYDKEVAPELESVFSGYDQIVSVYIFFDNGLIYTTGAMIIGRDGTPEYTSCGRWEKSGNTYKVSLIGFGECDSTLQDDGILLKVQTSPNTIYMRLKKLYPFDPYSDYVYR